MKKKILAISLAVICLSLISLGALAFFTAEEKTHNVITSGKIDIEIFEWADSEKTVPFSGEISGVMPGTEVIKIAEIKNTGDNGAFIRCRIDKSVKLKDASLVPDENLVNLQLNKTDWTEGPDGYFYYNRVLEPGKVTEPLLEAVSFDKKMDNTYKNCSVSVDIAAYAVQSVNNGTSALTASGWSAE